MGQSCLDTSRLVSATSQTGLLLIKKRKMQAEKLVSVTPHVRQSDLREIC